VPILLQTAAITDTSSLKRGFELVTCRQLILAVLNYAGLREEGLAAGGGRTTSLASLPRFCAIAASVNSN
jgi:hypothetical protein